MIRTTVSRVRTSTVLLAACATFAVAGCSNEETPSAEAHPTPDVSKGEEVAQLVPDEFREAGVEVAVFGDWAPEEYVENGEVKGWSVDLAKAISARMGVEFTYHPSSFDAIIPGLTNERYDLAVASLGVTPERLKSLDFVPLQKEGTAFGWKAGTDQDITELADACGKSVAVLTGAWEYEYLTEANPKECSDSPMDIQQFKDQPSAELAVTSGRVELVAAGSGKLRYAASQTGQLDVSDLLINAVYNGLGVPQGSELGPAVEAALQSLIDDGTYLEIREEWGVSSPGDLNEAVLITEDNPTG
ncbi:transporter substrate-binding domain-containing protein [Ornithinimicrobium cavernae]|uniref:transporter substrate-binding domain-containing protein n=1 Tax=Ornithinimicrobium cavernae TaxID=2666047 RepID=UPI000D69A2C2|nr:transporter substrate-binding domain-containing protein [Ornithinimicrobium cavernae]